MPQDPLVGAGKPCSACCHHDPAPDKWQKMDGWIVLIHNCCSYKGIFVCAMVKYALYLLECGCKIFPTKEQNQTNILHD